MIGSRLDAGFFMPFTIFRAANTTSMKSLLSLLIFLFLLPVGARALSCLHKQAPVLHSVFDTKPDPLPLTDALFLNPHPDCSGFFGRRQFDPEKVRNKREAGIYLMVFGGIALAGASSVFIKVARTTPQDSMDSYSQGWQLILGALIAGVGLALFVPGIIMLLRYSKTRSWY
jgi:hypothetical protein